MKMSHVSITCTTQGDLHSQMGRLLMEKVIDKFQYKLFKSHNVSVN